MDVFGTLVNATTLVGQIIIVYRHIAAMQSFGAVAGMCSWVLNKSHVPRA